MLNQILYETQVMSPTVPAPTVNEQNDGISIQFFKHINRIRNGIENIETNLLICYKPKALAKCIDVLLTILAQFAKNKEVWSKIVNSSRDRFPNDQSSKEEGKDASEKEAKNKSKKMTHGKSMEVVESDSEDEDSSCSLRDPGHRSALLEEDAALTAEDR